MKLVYLDLKKKKGLYDKATKQEDKDRIAHGFMQDDADIVLSEMKKKLEEDERDVGKSE